MSCVDTEKVSKPQVEIIPQIDDGDLSKGKPCIDFQPDDRWGIKEESKANNVPNSNDKISNGRRSLRLRNSKSNEAHVNGETIESHSDGENGVSPSVESCNDVNKNDGEKNSSKRKRSLSKDKSNDVEGSECSEKKMKLNSEETSDNAGSEPAEKAQASESMDTEEPSEVIEPDSSSSASNSDVTESKNGNLNDSVQVIDIEKEAETKNEISSEKGDSNSEVKPDSATEEKAVKTVDPVQDDEIEIINLFDDSKKSDDESDSEVQVINMNEEAEPKADTAFQTSSSSMDSICLTAGFPYYNSIKEKVKNFKAGEYKPVKFPHTGTLLLGENEVIIESPSLLVPLLIKEADEIPKLEGEEKKPAGQISSLSLLSKRNFFQSSVGQFLLNLGTSRVQEWYHRDMKKVKLKQLKSTKPTGEDVEKSLELHDKRLKELKEINAVFNFGIRQCKYCSFKTESMGVMEGHLLIPHLTPRREYRCNFCDFLTRDPSQIAFHFEALHGKKAVLEANVPFHECIFCSYDSPLKNKINVHMNRCRKHFLPSQNLAPPFEFEFPGVTTKPVTLADVIGHRRLLLNSAKNRMPGSEDARKKLQSVLTRIPAQNIYPDPKNPNLLKQLMASQTRMSTISSASTIQLPPGIVITQPRGAPIQQMRPLGGYPQPRGALSIRAQMPRQRAPYNTAISTAPRQLGSSGISITPITRAGTLPRPNQPTGIRNVTLTPIGTIGNQPVLPKPGTPQPVALFSNLAGSSNLVGQPQARLPTNVTIKPMRTGTPYQRLNTPPSQVIKNSSGNTFVMCEICDAYIKDLEELRTHMNALHKVKIHPKMLVSRPPLNCQKCQWRFFTDQGLERHLLGAHGLVTTNMQEMANKNQDGGRCIICGAVFTYKLVSHMTQTHKVTLKPAHLSYKCTVCTATFTLYRLFESHVYNVHSNSSKRAAEESSEASVKKTPVAKRCKECNIAVDDLDDHLIEKHIKECSLKLCRIEKCKKCLYSSDEIILIRMSDFGIEENEEDSSGDSDSSSDSSDQEEEKESNNTEDKS